MPRLSPVELQEARRQSGRLGGRPRKPTVEEARREALQELVPKSLRVLEEHLDSGRPDSWRAALRVLEHAWGRPRKPSRCKRTWPRGRSTTSTYQNCYELRERLLTENGLGEWLSLGGVGRVAPSSRRIPESRGDPQ